MTFFHPKRSFRDIWPIRNKRVLLICDQKLIASKDKCAIQTIEALLGKHAKVILLFSFGQIPGTSSVLTDDDLKGRIKAFQDEEGYGFTNYFAKLPPEAKVKILKKSTKQMPTSCNATRFTGKSRFFSSLENDEKRRLLDEYMKEMNESYVWTRVSTKPLLEPLQEIFSSGTKISFCEDPLHAGDAVKAMKPSEILVLENLRFYEAECSPNIQDRNEMAKILATYGDFIVNDAFHTTYCYLASATALPRLMNHCACGYLIEKELDYFTRLLVNPTRPLALVVGGFRLEEKLSLINALISKVDRILIGGPIAGPFLQAIGKIKQGINSVPKEFVEAADDILTRASQRNIKVILPVDFVISDSLTIEGRREVVNTVPKDKYVVDVGPKSLNSFLNELQRCKSMFWTGPLGLNFGERHSKMTYEFARRVPKHLTSIVGGHNSISAIREVNAEENFSNLCSSGIACLQMLVGAPMPGIEAISDAIPVMSDEMISHVGEYLRRLILFGGCNQNDLNIIARKAQRQTHQKGDVLIYSGDRFHSMWLVLEGQLRAFVSDEIPPREVFLQPHQAIGELEFISRSHSTQTVEVVDSKTVTIEVTSNAIIEILSQHSDISSRIISNLSMILRRNQAKRAVEGNQENVLLENDLRHSRLPLPLRHPPTWISDVISSSLSVALANYTTSLLPLKAGPSEEGQVQPIGGEEPPRVGIHEAARTTLYHLLMRLSSRYGEPSPFIVGSLASVLTVPLRLWILGRRGEIENKRTLMNYGLTELALSFYPAVSHGFFLLVRRSIEKSKRARLQPSMSLILSAFSRVIAGLAFFPIASRECNLEISEVYKRNLIFYLVKILIMFTFQVITRNITDKVV